MNYISIPVPENLVQQVYELLANGAQPQPNGGLRDDRYAYDEAIIGRLWRESGEPVKRLLVFLAARPDEEVSTPKVADSIALERGVSSLAGMLGALSRRCMNRYGRELPFEVRHRPDYGESVLVMPRTVAEMVRAEQGTP